MDRGSPFPHLALVELLLQVRVGKNVFPSYALLSCRVCGPFGNYARRKTTGYERIRL